MPRTPRVKSESGNYHVVLRGINKQRIFEDRQDYDKYFWILKDQQKQCGFSLFAWCLMSNHIHLLIKENAAPISRIFQGIGSRFVYWYNAKYKRTGPLFEGRYHSEPVEYEEYFLKVVRYIHMNPVKAGICRYPDEYPYSSYAYYFNNDKFTDSHMLFGLITKKEFEQYHKEENDDICLDYDTTGHKRITDEEAAELIRIISGLDQISMVKSMDDPARRIVIRKLLSSGVGIRQINRLTGVPIRIIEDIKAYISPS